MKSALIAAIVAAVVSAAAATATTTVLITSKQIKNGTIQTVDISAKAKRALKGNRGPRGFTGAPGPQGVQGPAGPAGPQGPAGTFTGVEVGSSITYPNLAQHSVFFVNRKTVSEPVTAYVVCENASGLLTQRTAAATIPPGGFQPVDATCVAGELALSGGFGT